MAEGRWHGLVSQAELRAAVTVIRSQHPSPSLPVAPAAVVPPFQMLRHQGLLHVLGQQLISGPLPVPWWSHCSIGILGKTICPVTAVVPVSVMSMIAIHLVGRVDIVVALHFIFVHIGTISVRLHVRTGVSGYIVGTGCIVCRGLTYITTTRMVLHQVRHTPSISIHFHLPVETMHGGVSGVQCTVLGVGSTTVLQAGLTGVGGTILQCLCAVAAVG